MRNSMRLKTTLSLMLITAALLSTACRKKYGSSCEDSPKSLQLISEQSFKVECKPFCAEKPGRVQGNGTYTIDSSICRSALHAGVINDGDGGVVKVKILPGQAKYEGGMRNGIESFASGPSEHSFEIK